MNRYSKGLTYIAVVALSGTVSYGAMLPFEKNDSLETLRAKISHNGYKFKVKRNRIFGMPEEQKKLFFSRHQSEFPVAVERSDDVGPLSEYLDMALPASFDWRNYNGHSYIGPIRDQGSCGSCYAFGATAAAEGTYNAYLGLYDDACVDFSESFIAFCLSTLPDYAEHFNGCYGADYEYMELEALTDKGICLESYFPYRDSYQPCPDAAWDAPKAVFDSWHRIPCGDVNAIKAAIMTYGVVDAAVYVTTAFQAYSSGVYEDSCQTCYESPCYYTPTNHLVALVGWDDNPPEGGSGCWILRNSWGEDWGENGYMRIRYWSARVACEACYITYGGDQLPTPEPTPQPTATPTPPPTETPPFSTTPTATPSITPTPAHTQTVAPTPTMTQTPTVVPTTVVDPIIELVPSDYTLQSGDSFAVDFSVRRTVVGLDKVVEYVLLRTPQGQWFSFVPNGPGKIALTPGIKPAITANRITPVEARIFSGTIGETLPRGDYWFGAAVFETGEAVTLDDWRFQALYYSEATVAVQ